MQTGAARPCDTATTPKSPTSVEVSKPSPNKNPTINMCHGLEIAWNSRGQHLNHKPIVASWPWSPPRPFHSIQSCRAVYKLRIPRASKKVEEIARPNTLPYAWKVLSMFFMKLFVNKMPQQASKTTRECPRAKNLGDSKGAKLKPCRLSEHSPPNYSNTRCDSGEFTESAREHSHRVRATLLDRQLSCDVVYCSLARHEDTKTPY